MPNFLCTHISRKGETIVFRNLYLLSVVLFISQSGIAATQSHVTPYDDLQTRLALSPGSTYLGFMKKEVKPMLDSYEDVILSDPASRARNYGQLQKNLIAKGAGVAIRIDGNNYIFNIGYLNGRDPKNDVKSGRSYGVGPDGVQSDPSDIAYLRELENYLKSEPDSTGNFVEALMRVLTNCDPSGWAQLSNRGQDVATDFLAIYTAELDRHLMVNLEPGKHPWEIDLAAATFLSIFNVASGVLMQNGMLVEGSIENWWAPGNTGSGIGITRSDRKTLQKLITRVVGELRQVEEISSLVGDEGRNDPIQSVLEYLNSPTGPEQISESEAERMTELMKSFLLHLQAHANRILEALD